MTHRSIHLATAALAIGMIAAATPLAAQRAAADTAPMELSLEQLMGVEVRSVSRREERVFEAPAAVFVLTASDLRRTGVASVQEALQLVPGVQAAQLRSSQWAIGSRGFAGQYANKLLVLIDGRSVYSRLFAGVIWEEENLPISEIERIEVIRGPGATLWGANAVNGVINIVTKAALASDGTHISARAGRLGNQELAAQQSGSIGDEWSYRIFANRKGGDALESAAGGQSNDDWKLLRSGLRTMWKRGSDRVTFSADGHQLEYGTNFPQARAESPYPFQLAERNNFSGGHALARWERTLSPGSAFMLQSYFAGNHRNAMSSLDETERTFDVEVQHQLTIAERQRLVWGGGFRSVAERNRGILDMKFVPENVTERFWNAFVQDEIALVPHHAFFTVGGKLERNDYTGWEFQPKASVSVLPSARQTVWGSVARAVRIPASVDRNVDYPQAIIPSQGGLPPAMITLVGNKALQSEVLTAWEAGYRLRPTSSVSFDLALFYNDYSKVRIFEMSAPQFVPTPTGGLLRIEAAAQTTGTADIAGAELLSRWEPMGGWVLEGVYSYLSWDWTRTPTAVDQTADREGSAPKHQVRLRSSSSLPGNVDLDMTYRYVGALPSFGLPLRHAFDARVAWAPTNHIELAVGGRNMLSPPRAEFLSESRTIPSRIPWSAHTTITVRF